MTQPEFDEAESPVTASEIASDAYLFGYPLVLTDVTRRVGTAIELPGVCRAPINQLAHMRAPHDLAFTGLTCPNADTLCSSAWLDLSLEPIVLSVPEMCERYYLVQMLDAWTNVFVSLGTRTTGNARGAFAVVGPQWSGELATRLPTIKAPTNIVRLFGQTQTNGPQDAAAVHTLQDQYALTPVSAWEKPYRRLTAGAVDPTIDVGTPPAAQVARMDAPGFFRHLNALMMSNPPSTADAPALARFESLSVGPGRTLDAGVLEPVLAAGAALAQRRLAAEARRARGPRINGWTFQSAGVGRYGTNYLERAMIAVAQPGAMLPDDAVSLHATTDRTGDPLQGDRRYVIRFPKGAIPPAKAFWSVTMYDATQSFVDNPMHRYAIGDRDGLTFDTDGSLSLYLQHDSPGHDKESNWLPAPAGDFSLIMRLYWPRTAILDGTWQPPAVERAH